MPTLSSPIASNTMPHTITNTGITNSHHGNATTLRAAKRIQNYITAATISNNAKNNDNASAKAPAAKINAKPKIKEAT